MRSNLPLLPSPFSLTSSGDFRRNNPREVTPAHRHLINLDIVIITEIVIILVTFAHIDLYRATTRL